MLGLERERRHGAGARVVAREAAREEDARAADVRAQHAVALRRARRPARHEVEGARQRPGAVVELPRRGLGAGPQVRAGRREERVGVVAPVVAAAGVEAVDDARGARRGPAHGGLRAAVGDAVRQDPRLGPGGRQRRVRRHADEQRVLHDVRGVVLSRMRQRHDGRQRGGDRRRLLRARGRQHLEGAGHRAAAPEADNHRADTLLFKNLSIGFQELSDDSTSGACAARSAVLVPTVP